MSDQTNLTRIKSVHLALGPLAVQSAFVGGATVTLYNDRPVREPRPTDDVDVVVELTSYSKEAELDGLLRKQGFQNDVMATHRYRYIYQGLIIDIVPVESNVAGFKNRWYPDGFKNAINYYIDDHATVKIFTAPYFLATKIEAFKDRGEGDGRQSQDFEDIVFVLENRRGIWNELEETQGEIRDYLQTEFGNLIAHKNIREWISCHVDQMGSPPADYFIIPNLEKFVAKKP